VDIHCRISTMPLRPHPPPTPRTCRPAFCPPPPPPPAVSTYTSSSPRMAVPTQRTFGTAPADLPHVDLVSQSLRRQILDGKDVNLASLLIPYYEVPQQLPFPGMEDIKPKEDIRLKRSLSIAEFITAFGKYKRIMCLRYDRQTELDRFETYVVNLHNTYGSRFYEYVKLFSLKSSIYLATQGIKLDWSQPDPYLKDVVTAGAKANYCNLCGEVSHEVQFCHLYTEESVKTPSTPRKQNTSEDRHGRNRAYHNGRELCNNFNGPGGCTRQTCIYLHECKTCKATSHGVAQCRTATTGSQHEVKAITVHPKAITGTRSDRPANQWQGKP
jgi:hypothetical protein